MKYCIISLLILLSWLPAWSQRSSYDPATKQPAKQGDGFVDFAFKQVNSHDKDYGCQIDDARKLLVDETIKSVTSWAALVALSFLVLSFFLLLHQHRERKRREIIAAGLLAQYHNALADARSQADQAIRRYNALVNRTNTAAEAALRTASQPPERAQAMASATHSARDVKQPKPTSAPPPKDRIKTDENGAGRTEAAPQNREPEGDMIAQISTLQQQLHDSHEREKNLQKELMKMQRRMEAAQPKDANIVG
ncbi:MAG: hypothetical protein LAO76_00810 [Acidobacteriia bacterium]|nr:hypothetical protein [Terriglobia bacterium]